MKNNTIPVKTRELHNHHFDSTIWNDFNFRNDDIVISSSAKSGATWLQQIIAQLLSNGEEGMEVAEMSPWLDLRVPPKEVKLPMAEAQTHRRIADFIQTPIDEEKRECTLRQCSFDYMKVNATKSTPLGGAFRDGGAQTFIHKGTNGRWRETLSAQEVSKYERRAAAELDSECAQWLATGEIS